jgi:hypothetical protein
MPGVTPHNGDIHAWPVRQIRRIRQQHLPELGFGFLALSALFAIMLAGLAMVQPSASNWISEAAQAEFAATILVPDATPTRLAKPAMEIRTVGAN